MASVGRTIIIFHFYHIRQQILKCCSTWLSETWLTSPRFSGIIWHQWPSTSF